MGDYFVRGSLRILSIVRLAAHCCKMIPKVPSALVSADRSATAIFQNILKYNDLCIIAINRAAIGTIIALSNIVQLTQGGADANEALAFVPNASRVRFTPTADPRDGRREVFPDLAALTIPPK